ncbi:hypothetical protein PVAP13_8KG113001 [Panicum virgatum]|uniref:Uncharacterized protein n=1 Tax=Panicum virgatum TaxID=38727 RepID=A0A8T0PPE8_PANVG|nr:hypothetical protein PVAP13_8KG113001 [Panicum virgatum]
MLHLAWHDVGTYDKETKTGGPNGSIRFPQEYSHAANAGFEIAIDLLRLSLLLSPAASEAAPIKCSLVNTCHASFLL